MLSSLILTLLALAPPADATEERLLREVIEQALPGTDVPASGDRELFERVLGSELFDHEAVGPFDLYVMRADGLEKVSKARKIERKAVEGLEPLAAVMERHFGREDGLVSGRRFPIVLVDSDRREREEAYESMIALLDLCEADYSGWTEDNGTLWTAANRQGQVTRTWDVQIFNLASDALGDRDAFLDHGLGYNVVAHLVNRLLKLGTWGNAPNWFSQGLIDELDIQAYGEAWVGGDEWESFTPGWFREGWSGFLPEGHAPPPPPVGPPAGLETRVIHKGDAWMERRDSARRHWDELRDDVRGDAPASFVEMTRSTRPLTARERAYARLAAHVVLELAEPQGAGLLARLDRESTTPPHGMPDAEPLTSIVSEALQGLGSVEELESMTTAERMAAIGREGVAERIRSLGGEQALAIGDHREQSAWLYTQASIPSHRRLEFFNLFLEAEFYEQEAAWEAIGAALDQAVAATLEASRRYPKRDRDREEVVDAFWSSLSSKTGEDAGTAAAKTRRSSR